MQQLEIFLLAGLPVDTHWIRIALADKTEVVGIFQFLEARWITPKLPVEVLNRAHVRRAPMSQLFFAVAFDLLANLGKRREQSNRDERKGQHQRDQHVAALANL